MFARKNLNRSGTISVQLVSKRHGNYKVVETLGCSRDPEEVERLYQEAKRRITEPEGQLRLFSLKSRDAQTEETFIKSIKNSQVRVIGPELIFDRIGFNRIKSDLFRHVTIARLVYPVSKLKTIDYLYRYKGINISKNAIYRFLDELHSLHKAKVEKIAYDYTRRILKEITVVFYDVTTLYFETEEEDDLRKIGFSKDGKFQHPQIMLGLLVGKDGYPIGYDIFEGNTFEGHTLLPVLKKIQKKYSFKKATVIADAALLSKDNLKSLTDANYPFIIGARIKNESKEIKKQILKQSQNIPDNQSFEIKRPAL